MSKNMCKLLAAFIELPKALFDAVTPISFLSLAPFQATLAFAAFFVFQVQLFSG